MFAAFLLTGLLVLVVFTLVDLHDNVVIAKRYNPEGRVGLVPALAYNVVRTVDVRR